MANLDMGNMFDHHPERGGQIEAWIKNRRDQHDKDPAAFYALDNLLDEYRLAADTGQSLYNIVNPEDREPEPTRQLKKKPRTR